MENHTLFQQSKRFVLTGSAFIGAALVTGCAGYVRVVTYDPPPPAVVYVAPAPPPPPVVYEAPAPAVVVSDGPVVVDPGVVVIDVEPDPVERVYVYDPGFPPGVYFYSGFYYYGGYRYPHDVFIHNYVEVNVREHRFADPRENRQRAMVIETQHRRDYAEHGGHYARSADAHGRPDNRAAAYRGERRSPGDNRR